MTVSIDLFCGGGGASKGIFLATGVEPVLAVDFDPDAIATHKANHPTTEHRCEDVWAVPPRAPGGILDLLWASPDCREFSQAKTSGRLEGSVRDLPKVVLRWAEFARPRVIVLENVSGLVNWGPLNSQGRPIPHLAGETFQWFVHQLEDKGFDVQWENLIACDYGVPTSRKRLFLIARSDGEDIVWPDPTHGPGLVNPYLTAHDCMDYSIPSLSIFARAGEARLFAKKFELGRPNRPLAERTMERIFEGTREHILESGSPFVFNITHGGRIESAYEPLKTITAAKRGEKALVAPTLVQVGYGKRPGQKTRTLDIDKPLTTIVGTGRKHGLVQAFLEKHGGGNTPHHGIVTIANVQYAIADITMRMLSPRELARAQGFPEDFKLIGSRTNQIARIGKSVCPPLVEAIVRANLL